jgi:uncharacterized membrane protein
MSTHGHGHGHLTSEPEAAPHIRAIAAAVVIPFVIAALIGMAVLWPSGEKPESPGGDLADAVITGFDTCAPVDGETASDDDCQVALIELKSGPDEGADVEAFMPFGEGAPEFVIGDEVVIAYFDTGDGIQYEVVDFQRTKPLLLLVGLFVGALLVLSRWRGVAALAGLSFSILVLIFFILPALLDGKSPLAVAVVGSAVIMAGAMYLTHGVSVRTTVALVGTFLSLALTGLLGYYFVNAMWFTGLADEGTSFLQFLEIDVDARGLLLAGLVIGALGVLNDVTVTQTVAVWEVAVANPTIGRRGLLDAGLRLGREHVGATVNTLVLAYAGASLPVLMLLIVADQSLIHTVTGETIAQEIVRALVGSLGIIAAVPVTTALAALAVGAAPRRRGRRAKRVESEAG